MDTRLEEESSIVDHLVMQTLSACQAFISRSSAPNVLDCMTVLYSLDKTQDAMRSLLSSIEATTADGSQSSISTTSSTCTQRQTCPTHYEKNGFRSIDFVDEVLWQISGRYKLTTVEVYSIQNFLKYTLRAGQKDPWKKDAFKAADYITRALTNGTFLNEMEMLEEYKDDESED